MAAFYALSQENCIIHTDVNFIVYDGDENEFDTLFVDLDFDGTTDLWVYQTFDEYVDYDPHVITCNEEWEVTILQNCSYCPYMYLDDPGVYWWNHYLTCVEQWYSYRGARKKVGDGYLYAWFYCYKHNGYDGEFVFRDMAFCTIKDYHLFPGQMTAYDAVDERYLSSTRQAFAFPNPTSDVVNIGLNDDISASVSSIDIFDISGRLVKAQQSSFGSIDISGLAPGMYVMKVALDDGKVFEEKIVKE